VLKSFSGAPPVRLAIIGAGAMGRNHLRVARLIGAEIAGVADVNTAQARSVAAEFSVNVLTTLEDFDAAVIAVPTAAHGIIAFPLLQDGIHCLVEKPFASNEAECRRLIEAAAIGGAVLQVGHIERFNPAAEALARQGINPAVAVSRRSGGHGDAAQCYLHGT
jgi:predicted dehydrogenase